MVHPGGRPRTSTPPPEEMIKLGEEMIEWVKLNDPLHLSQWWSIEKFITRKVWDNMKVAPECSPYYEHALRLIGIKYLDKNSNIRDGISHRWQRVYFADLRQAEDEDHLAALEREHQVKQKYSNTTSDAPNQNSIDKDKIIMEQQAEIARLKANAVQ